MSSSKNEVYPLSLYLSSLFDHHDIILNQPTASPAAQMVSAVPDSLMVNRIAFNSNREEVKKKAVKKDRHSKIRTAQGLRDRRVRLSIGIAREFFDLQDMLGFDKASKTLDWLLKKSRNAIVELVQQRKLNIDDEHLGNNVDDAKKAETKRELTNIASKEYSVAKCKGKAKEMSYDHQETVSEITHSEMMDPFNRSMIFDEGEEITHPFYKEVINEFDNQESTKTKINLQAIMGQSYNQQDGKFLMMDQGSSSNYNTILPQNLDFDYEIQNPFVDQPFCAVINTRGFP